jgi:DNA-binding NarL/FixJ family response regulator
LNKITLALIIAKPGHLRNALQSLMRTVPQIELLAESNDPLVLLKMKETFPKLIVVDGSLIDEENWSVLTKTKADWPRTKVLVLTENDQQGQAARKAGADFYLLKGFPATELAQLIETALIDDLQNDNSISSAE